MLWKIIVVCLSLTAVVQLANACNGYKLKVHHIKNCKGSNNVIKLHNITATLNSKCQIKPSGCAENAGFKTAKLSYNVNKDGMELLSGEIDVCKEVKRMPEAGTLLETLGLPNQCPAPKLTFCGSPDKVIDISKYKNYLGMATGVIVVKLNIAHDSGTSCVVAKVEIKEK